MPLVVAGPGIPHGVRHTPVTTIDVTATILDLAVRVTARGRRDVDGAGLRGRKAVGGAGRHRGQRSPCHTRSAAFPGALTEMGLRTGRYAYFRYSTGEGELYDLATDPLQLRSRYDDPDYLDVRRDLAKLWRQYRFCAAAECRAPLPPAYQVSVAELAKITSRRATALRKYYGD